MEKMEERLSSLETRVAALEKLFQRPDAAALAREKDLSAKEFLIAKKTKSETQKVVALVYFLEHHQGVVPANVSDLESMFGQARETPPKNMNDAVNKNVARGFLMEAKEKKDSKKAWMLTATGEKFVEEGMG
jgi:hypothetical protein